MRNTNRNSLLVILFFLIGFSLFIGAGIAKAADAPVLGGLSQKQSDTIPGSTTEKSDIITCGRPGQQMCTLCNLIEGLNNIIQYLMKIAIGVALLAFSIGGLMYAVSAGDSKLIDNAKAVMKNAAIGFVLIFAAYLIINTTIEYIGSKKDLGISIESWGKFECKATMSSVTAVKDCKTKKLVSIEAQCENGPTDSISLASTTTSEKPSTYSLKAMATYDCTEANGVASEIQEDVTQKATWKATDETIAKADKGVIKAIAAGNTPINVSYVDGSSENKTASIDVFVDSCPLDSGGDQTSFLQKNNDSGNFLKNFGISTVNAAENSCAACHIQPSKKNVICKFVGGSLHADKIFVIARANKGFAGNPCNNPSTWDPNDKNQMSQFRLMVYSMGMALEDDEVLQSKYEKKFALYYSDKVYPANQAESDAALKNDCRDWIPSGMDGKPIQVLPGFVIHGDASEMGERAYAFKDSSKPAFYCDQQESIKYAFAHEQLGHQFAKLSDEYDSKEDAKSKEGITVDSLNCTVKTSCDKWSSIYKGCYEGCLYMNKGAYRSTFDSIMRNHTNHTFSSLHEYIINYRLEHFESPEFLKENIKITTPNLLGF